VLGCSQARQMLGAAVRFGVESQVKELEADRLRVMCVQESR
jgi:hypothetical protein